MNARALLLFPALAAVLALPARATVSAVAPGVNFEQRIGEQLPLALEFTDTQGERHALRDYFGTEPVVLYFGYAKCPQLCSLVADGTVSALRQIRPAVGRDLTVISISLDPTETLDESRERQTNAVRRYGHTGAPTGWVFLTGDHAAIRAAADAVGFHYTYDPRSKQYAHPSGFVVLTSSGVVSRYFLGLDFPAPDVVRAINRAAAGKTGLPVYDLLLLCFHGGGITGAYGQLIWRALTVAVVLTVVTLFGGIAWMLRAEFRARRLQEGRP
ncbi:SCO family protein [Horticoccus luteus]|uniref:SCO family protein n=1 Tax=Horticoccus luteus TaxID=2862869 RepID=A0A8F9TVG7_9BACT|nr:SCO family protein [Horticoccus luteus]QYM78807.1 SCO family protein [Horticoccus luteus]